MRVLLLLILMIASPTLDLGGRRASVLWHGQSTFLQVSPQDPNATPRLQPLPKTPIVNVLIQGAWQLDGLNCIGCRFRNAVLRSSGGSFRCRQCWIEETLTISFSGAAVNTLAVSGWLTKIRAGADATFVPTPTVTETVHLRQPLKVDLISPAVSQ